MGAIDVRNNQLESLSTHGPTDDGRVNPDVIEPEQNLSLPYGIGGVSGPFLECLRLQTGCSIPVDAATINQQQLRKKVETFCQCTWYPKPLDQAFGRCGEASLSSISSHIFLCRWHRQ